MQASAVVERFRDTPHWDYAQSLLDEERPEGLLEAEFSGALERLRDKMRGERWDSLVAKMETQGLNAAEKAEYQGLMAERLSR
ncbi:hypothetical protein [Methylogaea oryzae]|uniref:hypothetical protein n=1 Tax=Methylogaea oryzae TaxID=1295382 RepID=UPI0020D0C949|nr:hypothetical protein [Methylogaea oryzae]